MIGAPDGVLGRFGAVIPGRGVLLAAALLLVGCTGPTTGGDGSGGEPGADPAAGTHAVSRGGNGGDGGDGMDGTPGTPGERGADGADGIGGSGHLTTRTFPCPGVTSLLVGVSFVVQVKIGEPEQATITMDDNITDLVDTTVTGNQLRLGLKSGASIRNATLIAEVTVRHLDRLNTDGVSQVTLDSALTGQTLNLDADGASHVAGTINVDHAEVSVSGASMVALSGQVGHLSLVGAGTSRMKLPDLVVRNLEASLSGVSSATVAVSDTLAARTTGVSTLRYIGTPRITRQEASGVSSIASR